MTEPKPTHRIEFEVVTTKGKGFVYADKCAVFPASYGYNRMTQFYRDGYVCYTAHDVISVRNTDTGEEVQEQ